MSEPKNLDSILREEFEWLHRHPELALQEIETTEHIKIFLQNHGVELLDLPLQTGVLAVIRGKNTHPVIVLRADIDALPLQEETELSYKSSFSGRMHACGHDFHTASLLGAAILLQDRKDVLEGTVELLFQPAEETASGAEKVLATGLLDDADMIFGLHVRPDAAAGTIFVKSGADHAAVDRFQIDIRGIGAHAAHPNLGTDSIVAAAALIQGFQTVVSRNVDPVSEAVVSVTRIEAGKTWNIIPGEAQLEGTMRTFDEDTRRHVKSRLESITEGVALSYDVKTSIRWLSGTPATNNDPKLVEFIRKTAGLLGYQIEKAAASMGGEDFAVFQQKFPGVIWQIGVGSGYFLHHPKFEADESALWKSAYFMSQVAERSILDRNEGSK